MKGIAGAKIAKLVSGTILLAREQIPKYYHNNNNNEIDMKTSIEMLQTV